MKGNNTGLGRIGEVLFVMVVVAGVFAFLTGVLADVSNTPQSKVSVGNAFPSVSGMHLNNDTDITLTANATTAVNFNYTVSDNNGCTDMNTNAMTSTLKVASDTCSAASPATNTTNCYLYVSRVTSTCSGTSINGTDTFQVWYFANSTGAASATRATTTTWAAHMQVYDAAASTTDATSSNQNINVLTAITVTTTTINYGAMSANSTSSAAAIATQIATTTNAGNSTSALYIYASATLTNGPNSIATSSQHYATSSFTFGGNEQLLQQTQTLVPAVTLQVQTSTTVGASSSKATFWGLNVPAGSATGSYTGTNVFSSASIP